EYKILGVSGPPHNPCYEVEVLVNGELLAKGVAAKRKLAEQAAAKAAMEVLSAQRKNNP
ncbi:MAG: ribonuclease III, partial [Lentisphaeria bacterium]|nr:ribonuclease III [Lentisphaeria bacterium]